MQVSHASFLPDPFLRPWRLSALTLQLTNDFSCVHFSFCLLTNFTSLSFFLCTTLLVGFLYLCLLFLALLLISVLVTWACYGLKKKINGSKRTRFCLLWTIQFVSPGVFLHRYLNFPLAIHPLTLHNGDQVCVCVVFANVCACTCA